MGAGKNKQKALTHLPETGTGVREPKPEGQGSDVVGLGDMKEHIENLKQVSATAKILMNLLGGQLQGLSTAIPVLRGFDIARELRQLLKEHHEGLEEALDPLRAYIETQKKLFWVKNAGPIERMIRKRVEEGVKAKLPAVLEERLRKYKHYIKTNGALAEKVQQAMAATSARATNSVLLPNHPDEQVALIPPHPKWNGLTLGNLKNIGGPAAAKLGEDQGLTSFVDGSDPELARVHNLNMILRYLGIRYQAIPSRNGLLLMSVPRHTTSH